MTKIYKDVNRISSKLKDQKEEKALKNSKDIKDSIGYKKIRKKFSELFQKAQNSMKKTRGRIYKIKVSKILDIGLFSYRQPEIIIVEDSKGRCWIIPETGQLISRYDVHIGDRLEIKVIREETERIVSQATII